MYCKDGRKDLGVVYPEGVCGPGAPALASITLHAGLSLTLQQSKLGLAPLPKASYACKVEGLGACRAWLSNFGNAKRTRPCTIAFPRFTACRYSSRHAPPSRLICVRGMGSGASGAWRSRAVRRSLRCNHDQHSISLMSMGRLFWCVSSLMGMSP